jgi:hypothetical protein
MDVTLPTTAEPAALRLSAQTILVTNGLAVLAWVAMAYLLFGLFYASAYYPLKGLESESRPYLSIASYVLLTFAAGLVMASVQYRRIKPPIHAGRKRVFYLVTGLMVPAVVAGVVLFGTSLYRWVYGLRVMPILLEIFGERVIVYSILCFVIAVLAAPFGLVQARLLKIYQQRRLWMASLMISFVIAELLILVIRFP